MKPPPFLLGAALVFWGWQTDFLIPGVLMALVVEAARFTKARWDFSDDDFNKVWTFCALTFLAASVYAFTSNNGPANFGGWVRDPGFRTQGAAGLATARTAAAMFRWLPMIFFPFLAAQLYSGREAIPLTTISLILRRRWKQAKREGRPLPPPRDVNIGYPFLAGTLLAASVHQADDTDYFWGLAVLVTWALWPQRSRRFGPVIWLGVLTAGLLLGHNGQRSFGLMQRYLVSLNAEWLSRFMRRNFDPAETRTTLGQVGSVKTSGRIVVRLEPQPGSPVPTYLREASYRIYRAPAWLAGNSRDDFEPVTEVPVNSGNWTLLAGSTNTRTLRIACELEGVQKSEPAGLLPLPAGVVRLDNLPAYLLSRNSAGAVLAVGPGLVIFDAHYHPDATLDSPPGFGATNRTRSQYHHGTNPDPYRSPTNRPRHRLVVTNEDLHVPEREIPALETLITDLQLRGRPRADLLRQIAAHFADHYTYRTWQPTAPPSTNDTALSHFLRHTRAGHCEYFATATTLLLRQLGHPTRYAVGYAVHEPARRGYVVRARDAHAWTLVWNPDQKKWDDYDTTPATWIKEESQRASAFQWLQDAWGRLHFELAKIRWGQSNLRRYLLLGILPALLVLLYQILFRRRRRRPQPAATQTTPTPHWPGLDSDYYQLEPHLTALGQPRAPGEPLIPWLERLLKPETQASEVGSRGSLESGVWSLESGKSGVWSLESGVGGRESGRETRDPRPETRDPRPETRDPRPETRDPRLPTLDPRLENTLREILRLHYRLRFDPAGLPAPDRATLRRHVRACTQHLTETKEG